MQATRVVTTAAARSQPLTTQIYQVADCQFEVVTDGAEARRIWEMYGRKYCLTTSTSETVGWGRILIHYRQPLSRPDLLTWSVEEVEHGSCWTKGTDLWLEIANSWLFVTSAPTPRVQLWLGATADARTDTALDAVIAYALTALLRRREYYSLHAAGLLEPTNRQGVLLIGDSGSGKSTLTVRLAQHGWQYLSDDQIVLTAKENGITAWGLRRVFSLTPETLNACWQAPSFAAPSHGKCWVEPRLLFAGQAAAQCQPTTLFFTKLNPTATTTVTPITPSEAMLKLIRQCPWLCYDPAVARDYTQALTTLTQQCRAYQISAGRDLLESPNLAPALLTTYLP